MISEALVLASCLMLATAQFQLQTHQYQSLTPNVQPFQFTSLPNSQVLMTNHANTIMNQDTSIPISPGPLSGAPVLVSEATQNILDQEPRIVGYNVPIQLVPQQQQIAYFQSPQQQLIPIFQTGYSANSAAGQPNIVPQSQPQTISFPVINIAPQQQQIQKPVNVVPVQAIASLKSVIETSKLKEALPVKTKYHSHYSKPSTYNRHKTEYRSTITRSTPRPRSQVYQDIPHDHPLPAPLVHKKTPSNHQNNDGNRFQEPSQDSDFAAPARKRESDIEALRPPLPPSNRQRSRSQQPSASASENFSAQNYNSRRNHRSNEKDSHSSAHEELLEVVKAQRDSSSQSSDNFYQQAPTRNQENYSGQSSYSAPAGNQENYGGQSSYSAPTGNQENYSGQSSYSALTGNQENYGGQSSYSVPSKDGYSSYSAPIVHKHIFVHASPPETYNEQPRVNVIRPAPPPEQHVQLIFVKSPAPPPQEQTVVELPENPPLKTIVYVLAKNQEGNNDVKIVRPPPTKPPAPEIYFIRYGQRYGDKNSNQGYPVPNLQSLYDNYGSHSQPAEAPYKSGSPLRSKRNHDGLAIYAPLMSYSTSGQINEITQQEAEFRRTNVDAFFK